MKNLNYKIQDCFEHDELGIIISIASPELDKLSDDEIKNIVGDRVAILDSNSHQKKWAIVSRIEIANSIIDKKNVSVCLGNSIKLLDIKPNSNLVLSKKILV